MLFSVIIVGVTLFVLEGAVRLRAWIRYGTAQTAAMDSMLVTDPTTGLARPRPGYEQRSDRVSIKINSLGFRGDEIAVVKPPRTIRIATVGASTTFCAEVSSNDATWPHRLQQLLQRAHPDVRIEVINAGVPGYLVSESLRNLEAHVLPLDPDLVIYYEANNDLAFDTRQLARQQGLIATDSAPVRELTRRSLLFDLLRKNFRILRASRASTGKLVELPRDLPRRYIGELDKMRRLLADRRIPLVLSTFFVKYRRDQPRDLQVQNASVVFYYMPWMTIEMLLDGIDLYNDAIVEYAKGSHLPVVDDRDSIPADSAHFTDWTHFADGGARMMAERFTRFLEDHGLIRGEIARLTQASGPENN